MESGPSPAGSSTRRNRMTSRASVSVRKVVSRTLKDYADVSTAHGISYVFDKNLLGLERLMWFMVCVSFVSMAAIFSCQAYNNWQDDPIITSVKTTGETWLS